MTFVDVDFVGISTYCKFKCHRHCVLFKYYFSSMFHSFKVFLINVHVFFFFITYVEFVVFERFSFGYREISIFIFDFLLRVFLVFFCYAWMFFVVEGVLSRLNFSISILSGDWFFLFMVHFFSN